MVAKIADIEQWHAEFGETQPMTEREFGELTGTLIGIQKLISEGSLQILQRAMERLHYLETERTRIEPHND